MQDLERQTAMTSSAAEVAARFYSQEMAQTRYDLYDLIVRVFSSASQRDPAGRALAEDFGVTPLSRRFPSRYALQEMWMSRPPISEDAALARESFLRNSAVLTSLFDSYIRASEESLAGAEYLQRRMGRIVVWWLLVWPGAFDHTDSFLLRRYLRSDDIREADPEDAPQFYTETWTAGPLWTREQWLGAVDNYRQIRDNKAPGDRWRNFMKIRSEESIYGEEGNPLDYPSTLRSGCYYVDDDEARAVIWDWKAENIRDSVTLQPISELDPRASSAVASMPDRIPQIAFGANRDIANLVWKFRNYAESSGEEAEPFFVLPAYVPDADVVMCNIGYWGYVYAALLTSRGGSDVAVRATVGNNAPVAVLLLTPKQMEMMHVSEGVPRPGDLARQGVSCDVALLNAVVEGKELKCQQYVLPLPLLSVDGESPMGFSAVPHVSQDRRRWSQEDAWAAIIEHPDVRAFLRPTELSVPSLIGVLRRGAASRKGGGAGSGDRSQEVYDFLRNLIIERICLRDDKGRPVLPSDGLQVLSPEDAWVPGPALGASV